MSFFLDHIDNYVADSKIQYKIELAPPVAFRWYQKDFLNSLLSGKISRFYLLWSARAGKDLTCIYALVMRALTKPRTTYAYVFPTMKLLCRALIRGNLDDGRELLGFIPRHLLVTKNNDLLEFTNGSKIYFLASDKSKGDSVVAKTWDGVIISEFALMLHPQKLLDAMLGRVKRDVEDSFVVINTTPRGSIGASFTQWEEHVADPEFCYASKVTMDQIYSKEYIAKYIKRMKMREFAVRRELYCDFYAPVEGSIYGELIESFEYKKISDEEKRELLDNYTVFIGMDLGFKRDPCALWFFVLTKEKEFIFIDFKIIYHSSLFDILEEVLLDYSNTYFFLPHDSDRGDGSSVKDRFLERGIPHMVLKRTSSVTGDIKSMVRPFFNERKVFFDKNKNVENGIAYLKSYRTKDNGLVHHGSDGASDAADALRYAVVGAYKHVALSHKRL